MGNYAKRLQKTLGSQASSLPNRVPTRRPGEPLPGGVIDLETMIQQGHDPAHADQQQPLHLSLLLGIRWERGRTVVRSVGSTARTETSHLLDHHDHTLHPDGGEQSRMDCFPETGDGSDGRPKRADTTSQSLEIWSRASVLERVRFQGLSPPPARYDLPGWHTRHRVQPSPRLNGVAVSQTRRLRCHRNG